MSSSFENCEVIHDQSDHAEVHRAAWVVVTPWEILENGYVRVEENRIVEVGRDYPGTDGIDHGSGVLMPGLVNAHVHFELSALKDRLSFGLGFKTWVAALLKERTRLGASALGVAARDAIARVMASGTLGVGEISTLGITRDMVVDSGLLGVWFQELLGSDDHLPDLDFGSRPDQGLAFSVAGHAPHTSSPLLLKTLKRESLLHDGIFSIHVAESNDEFEFIHTARGDWANFLKERGIDYSTWPLPAVSSVAYLDRLNLLDSRTLAVHLLTVARADFDILLERGVKTVVCPRSNKNLHDRLPCIRRLLDHGLTPALGTDSLASCESLSMGDEMAFVAQNYQDISPAEILAMATCYGAKALGIDNNLGTLEPGRRARFLFVPAEANNSEHLLEILTRNE